MIGYLLMYQMDKLCDGKFFMKYNWMLMVRYRYLNLDGAGSVRC